MADSSKKSKNSKPSQNGYAFGRLLPKVRSAIEAKLEAVLAPVSFDVALRTYSGYLSSEIPQSVWSRLFQVQVPKADETAGSKSPVQDSRSEAKRESENGKDESDVEDQPKSEPVRKDERPQECSLANLSLYEVILISQTLPPLKTKLSQEEKQAFARTQELLQDIHTEVLLRSDPSVTASHAQEDRHFAIETGLKAILDDLQAKTEELEETEEWSEKEFLDCPRVFRNRVLKNVAKLQASDEGRRYGDKELEKLQKLVKEAKAEKGSLDSESIEALRSSISTAINQALICGFCHGVPKEPRTLPCLHVCCGTCLKSNFENPSATNSTAGTPVDKQTIVCPPCHTRISMPSAAHIDQLPQGFVTETLMKLQGLISDGQTKENTRIECHLCIGQPTHVCLLCSEFYCTDHTANYYKHGGGNDTEQIPSHSEMVIPLSTLTSSDQVASLLYRFCPQHRQRLSHFCPGCRVPLCSHMLCVDWHSQHVDPSPGLRPIDEVLLEEHQKLAATENLLCKKAEKIRAKIDLVEKNQITVAEVQENVRQSIEKYFKDIEEKLVKQKATFLSDLDKAAAQCFQNDETMHSRLQIWTEKTEKLESAFLQYLDNRLSSNASATDSTSVAASVPELASIRFRILQQLSDSCAGALVGSTKRLSYPETRLRELQHSVGTLQSNITTASAGRGWESLIKFTTGVTPSAIGTPLHFIVDTLKQVAFIVKDRGIMAPSQVLSYDLKQVDNRTPHVIADAGPRSFESLAMDSQSRRLFAAEQPQSVLELPTMRYKKFIPVRLYEFNTIGVVSLLRTTAFDRLNTFSKAIIKYVSDRLYVCDGVCVCEYDTTGEFKLIRKFNFHNMLEIVDFAVEPERDFLYVVDGKKHCLLIFNCQHQVVKNIGEQGVTPGRFDQPAAVALDAFGHVFVADAGNFRVQVFDMDGKFLRLIQYPQAIKEIAQSPTSASDQKSGATSSMARVALQVGEDCLYMMDSRTQQLWRYRYM